MARATACSAAACSTGSRASCARASSRWKRSTASGSCMWTAWPAAGGGSSAARSPTDEVIESALRYRVQAPLIDEVLKEIGIEGGSLAKMGGLIREASDMQRIGKEASKDSARSPRMAKPAAAARRQGQGVNGNGPGLCIQRYQCLRRPGLGPRARFQRAAELASRDRRKPHREWRTGGQGRLHPQLLAQKRRSAARAVARPFRLRHVLHLLDPRIRRCR